MGNTTIITTSGKEMAVRRVHGAEWIYLMDQITDRDIAETGYDGSMRMYYNERDDSFDSYYWRIHSQDVKDEMHEVIATLCRTEFGNLWKPGKPELSPEDVQRRFYGRQHPDFTVRADLGQHTYMIRCADIPDDRDVIIYRYDREKLDAHIRMMEEKRERQAAERKAQEEEAKTAKARPAKIMPARAKKREGNISWDEYFMGVAALSAMRSKDPNTQVGCCIVGPRNRIASVGYNGFPFGCGDDEFPWDRHAEGLAESETKYPYVVHSELNAILNYRGESLDGAKMYVTMFPCCECTKAIIQAGIREVIYRDDAYLHSESGIAAMRMFRSAGVAVCQMSKDKRLTVQI